MHNALITFYVTPPGWIEVDTFNLLWLAFDYTGDLNRRAAYIAEYRLVFEVVEVAPDVFIPVYRFTGSWWPALFGFYSTTDPACASPCNLVTFPPVP